MKKHVEQLDIEGPLYEFDETAFVMIRTTVEGYALAIDLNDLYGFGMQRVEVVGDGVDSFVVYRCYDRKRAVDVCLVENGLSARGLKGVQSDDKLLLLQGRDAERIAQMVEHDLGGGTMDGNEECALTGVRQSVINYYQQTLTTATMVRFTAEEMAAANGEIEPQVGMRLALVRHLADIVDKVELMTKNKK
ncbi:MAG: hypothetical protein IJ761_07135 [Bacteroidales bacterium]|nr:hypothetical protein [Bacteroidales bacterium]